MTGRWLLALGLAGCVHPAVAAQPDGALVPATSAAPTPVAIAAASSSASALLAKPVILRGHIGEQQVEVRLHMKVPAEEGVEGDYIVFGGTQKILLAGEIDNDIVALEESRDGSAISGQWDGKVEGQQIRGTWLAAGSEVGTPFELTVVPAVEISTKKPVGHKRQRKAAAATAANSVTR